MEYFRRNIIFLEQSGIFGFKYNIQNEVDFLKKNVNSKIYPIYKLAIITIIVIYKVKKKFNMIIVFNMDNFWKLEIWFWIKLSILSTSIYDDNIKLTLSHLITLEQWSFHVIQIIFKIIYLVVLIRYICLSKRS